MTRESNVPRSHVFYYVSRYRVSFLSLRCRIYAAAAAAGVRLILGIIDRVSTRSVRLLVVMVFGKMHGPQFPLCMAGS